MYTAHSGKMYCPQHDTKDTTKVDDRAQNILNFTTKNIYTTRVNIAKHKIANIWSR